MLNFTTLKGKIIRVMYYVHNPSLRKRGVGNIFIKVYTYRAYSFSRIVTRERTLLRVVTCHRILKNPSIKKDSIIHFRALDQFLDSK